MNNYYVVNNEILLCEKLLYIQRATNTWRWFQGTYWLRFNPKSSSFGENWASYFK